MNLSQLSDFDLEQALKEIQAEQAQRLSDKMQPGVKVISIRPGFSSMQGTVMYVVARLKDGEYYDKEGPYVGNSILLSERRNGQCRWILEDNPAEIFASVKLL